MREIIEAGTNFGCHIAEVILNQKVDHLLAKAPLLDEVGKTHKGLQVVLGMTVFAPVWGEDVEVHPHEVHVLPRQPALASQQQSH